MFHFIAKSLPEKKAKLYRDIQSRMEKSGRAYEFHLASSKQETTQLAELYSREEGNTVVVIGGDGSLNDVLVGIHPEHAALGLIPAGTGNDFASSAKIPKGLSALELILSSQPKPTDYIQFSDGRRSLNIAGIGIDVDILERCERRKHFHARSKYFLSLLSSLCSYKGEQMTVHADGKTIEGKMLICAICNGRQFGGGIAICPDAEIADGLLDIVYVDFPKRRKILGALIKLMRGKVLSVPFAHRLTCTEAEFIPGSPITAQYDGELFRVDCFSARLERGLLMYRGE